MQKKNFSENAQCYTFMSATKITGARSEVIENIEWILTVWIEDQNQCNVPMSMMVIQKAKSFRRRQSG